MSLSKFVYVLVFGVHVLFFTSHSIISQYLEFLLILGIGVLAFLVIPFFIWREDYVIENFFIISALILLLLSFVIFSDNNFFYYIVMFLTYHFIIYLLLFIVFQRRNLLFFMFSLISSLIIVFILERIATKGIDIISSLILFSLSILVFFVTRSFKNGEYIFSVNICFYSYYFLVLVAHVFCLLVLIFENSNIQSLSIISNVFPLINLGLILGYRNPRKIIFIFSIVSLVTLFSLVLGFERSQVSYFTKFLIFVVYFSIMVIFMLVSYRFYNDISLLFNVNTLQDVIASKYHKLSHSEPLSALQEVIDDFNEYVGRYFKVSLLGKDQLPVSLRLEFVSGDKKEISIYDLKGKSLELKRFFVVNNFFMVTNVAEEVLSDCFLLFSKPRKREWVSIEELALLRQLSFTVSQMFYLVNAEVTEESRENIAREIENFEKLKRFLIKDYEMYFFYDRLAFYTHVPDPESNKGYAIDIVYDEEKMVLIVMYVPDNLMLSHFVLSALKGLIRISYPEQISYEYIVSYLEYLTKEKNIPLNFSLAVIDVFKDKIHVKSDKKLNIIFFCKDGRVIDEGFEEFEGEGVVLVTNISKEVYINILPRDICRVSGLDEKIKTYKEILNLVQVLGSITVIVG